MPVVHVQASLVVMVVRASGICAQPFTCFLPPDDALRIKTAMMGIIAANSAWFGGTGFGPSDSLPEAALGTLRDGAVLSAGRRFQRQRFP